MNLSRAKKIGRIKAYEAITIGVVVFYLTGIFIFSSEELRSLLWISYLDLYNWVFILNWLITFYFLAIFVGNFAGKKILIDNRNYIIIGLQSSLMMLVFGAFLGCFLGFITEGIDNIGTNDNPFVDYFFKPIFWIVIFGFIPSLLIGLFFGKRINVSK